MTAKDQVLQIIHKFWGKDATTLDQHANDAYCNSPVSIFRDLFKYWLNTPNVAVLTSSEEYTEEEIEGRCQAIMSRFRKDINDEPKAWRKTRALMRSLA